MSCQFDCLPLALFCSIIHEAMRHQRRSKLVVLPFSLSCISGSSKSTRVGKQAKETELADPTPSAELDDQKKDSRWPNGVIRKLIMSLSHLFAIHSKEEEEEEEEEEKEMEIGFPTDVKHVGHIGWDGFNGTNNSSKDWAKGPELLSLNSVSLKQFEAAMATLAAAPPLPLPTVRCSN